MANGGQVERFVVVSPCGEHRVIAQSRCLGLTGTDIHIYIHTYIHIYKRGTTTHHDYLPRLSAQQYWYDLLNASPCILTCHAHMMLQIPAYCPADINTPSHNMLASADRRRHAVIVALEQGRSLKAGFPACTHVQAGKPAFSKRTCTHVRTLITCT